MAEITAALVKDLRNKTGAGMMDCKKALEETDGDIEAAVDWLRTKGLAAASKRAGRTATEGLIGIVVDGNEAAICEVNAETDFVARNDMFQDFVRNAAAVVLSEGENAEAVLAGAYPGEERTVEEQLTHLIATIGENMQFRRGARLQIGKGVIGSYVHNAVAPDLGKMGVLVGLESDGDEEVLGQTAKHLAMHIAAANPQSVSLDDLDQNIVEREREILSQQARESGKPEEIIEKMVEGRLRKFYEEQVLLKQTWVIDGESMVEKIIEQAEKDAGAPITVSGFIRYNLGEGLEKKEEDFAAEVAAAAGS